MIVFVCRSGLWNLTMAKFFRLDLAQHLAKRVRVLSLERLLRARQVPEASTWVFVDHERFQPGEVEFLGAVADSVQAAAPGVRILNHPAGVLRRKALLRHLHDAHGRHGTAWGIDEIHRITRWPVILRHERKHQVLCTDLLHDEQQVREAIRRVRPRVAPPDLLLVEYIETRRPDGRWEKRSIHRIGDRFVPEHLFSNDHWLVKGHTPTSADEWRREADFLVDDRDVALTRPFFEIAGIDYGRIDYAVVDGRVVVFEINTNAALELRHDDGEVRPSRRASFERIAAAWEALDDGSDEPVGVLPLRVAPGVRRAAIADAARDAARNGRVRAYRAHRARVLTAAGRLRRT